jgi:hypothetical protein
VHSKGKSGLVSRLQSLSSTTNSLRLLFTIGFTHLINVKELFVESLIG